MNVLRAQLNKIKRYNIYSLFNVKNILSKILDRMSTIIICRVDITGMFEYAKLFSDFDIKLTKDNFKNYFNLSIEDIWKNLYNIDTFKLQTYYYDSKAKGWYYRTYTNTTDEVKITTPLPEMDITYYLLSLGVNGSDVFRYNEEGILFKGKHRYHVYLAFTESGELLEEESKICFYCDVEPVEDN